MNATIAALSLAALLSFAPSADAAAPRTARTNYMEYCGGCHGLEGYSAGNRIPTLRGRAGYFLCNRLGRDYAARLPNVVFTNISNSEMAALLNYVMFKIGAAAVPANAQPYRADELARTRKVPLTTTDLLGYRRKVVASLVADCGAPRSILTEYAPAAAGSQDSHR